MKSHEAISRSTRRMRNIGRFLIKMRVVKAWCDGDSVSLLWCWWNPISWVMVPVSILISIILVGIPETFKNKADLGLGLSNYWKERKNKRIFIKPSDINWRK